MFISELFNGNAFHAIVFIVYRFYRRIILLMVICISCVTQMFFYSLQLHVHASE